ncbi:MAG: carboxypeptidase-like regulatory domain-containing protein [Cyclobacteriaceae bacterium]|nr:carboxypeptidase-like regulatory domain-containing protein [Cyclobacteriaceae bacterium]
MRCIWIVLLGLMSLSALAQQVIRGRVIDSLKLEPVAFVNLILDDGVNGTTTGIDGYYELRLPTSYSGNILLSHVSYKRKNVTVAFLQENTAIKLVPGITVLQELVFVADENPALRIIREAVRNRKSHDPDYLNSYAYHAYNKFVIKPSEADSAYVAQLNGLRFKADTTSLSKSEKEFLKFDSLTEKMYLFMTESVTEKKVINPNRDKETLLAFRASGFKSPLFANVATDYQSFSFYKDNISLLGKDFLNPISKNSESRYNFYLTDTTFFNADTVYIIQYEPKKGKLINGLKGMISISTDGYAIKNVIAASADTLALTGILIQQHYEKIDGKWFPDQLNTDIYFYDLKLSGRFVMAQHRSFFRDVKINPDLKRSAFGDIKVDLTIPQPELNDVLLNRFRNSPVDSKEARTYSTLDSATAKLKWMDKLLNAAATQAWPLGFVEADLTKVLRFNAYEGIRLGAGIYTSPSFSKWIRLGGYAAYGFRDDAWKYGGEVRFTANANQELYFQLTYKSDIYEIGYSHENENRNLWEAGDRLRKLLSSRYDQVESYRAEVGTKVLPRIHGSVFTLRSEINPAYNYSLVVEGESTSAFLISEAGVTLRYSGKENYAQLAGKKIFLGRQWPYISITYASTNNFFGAQNFDYQRYELTSRFQVKHRPKGVTRLAVYAGLVDGIAPYGQLFTGRGSKEVQGILVDGFFQTMDLYEFSSSQYASIFFQHNFGNFLLDTRYSKPELIIYQNAGVGVLKSKGVHNSTEFELQDFSKGYYESGIGLNNLLRWKYSNVAYYGLGGSLFYRYGPYQFDKTGNNLVFRLTLNIVF